jgi:hypothetical protein
MNWKVILSLLIASALLLLLWLIANPLRFESEIGICSINRANARSILLVIHEHRKSEILPQSLDVLLGEDYSQLGSYRTERGGRMPWLYDSSGASGYFLRSPEPCNGKMIEIDVHFQLVER